MRSIMKTKMFTGAAVAAMLVACGAPEAPQPQARLRTPPTGHTRMTLAPALDVSSIIDPAILDRIVIDEVIVNVADVRMLGADPRLPTGGLRLLAGHRQLSTLAEAPAFPLPAGLAHDDLALFVRLEPSAALDGASVIVRARLYSDARLASLQSLLQRSEPDPDGSPAMEEPDPDGSPAMEEPDPDGSPAKTDPTKEPDPDGSPAKTDPTKEPDPDGSPAHGGQKSGGGVCEPDPDGSPALKGCKGARKLGLVSSDFIAFELRGSDVADLVVGLATSHPFDVVLGVPAARWLTSDTIVGLEKALHNERIDDQQVGQEDVHETVVVSSKAEREMTASRSQEDESDELAERGDDYRLLGGDDADPDSLRKH
jgi:hypothetical protein